MPSPVTVNLHVNIDASGNIVVFGSDVDSTSNIVEAVGYQLPVNALYDRTINNDNTNGAAGAGLIEFWEPVSDLGNIYAKLATSTDFNVDGQPSYKRTAKLLASGLERVLVDSLDAKAAIPFTSYNDANYTTCSDLGRLSLGVYAHYLFGHIGATAAITNDEAIMTNMLSLTYGTSSVKNGGLASNRYLAWTKKSIIDNDDVDSWDASQNATDANIAIALTKAILAKGANDVVSAVQDTPIRSVAGIQFGTDSLANIVKQVIGQDASRAMGQDNNTLAPNVRQILRFYEGDVIYVSITLKQPGVSVGHGYSNAGAPLSSSMTEQKYDIKISLGPRNIEYDPPILTVASSYSGVVADTNTFKTVAQTMSFNNSQPIPLSTLGIDVSASPNDAATKLIRNDVITTLFNLRQDISQFTVNRGDIGLTTSQTANDKLVVIKSVESAIAPPIPVDSVVNSTTSVYAPLVYIGDMNRFSIRSNVFSIYKKGVDVYTFTDNDGVVSLHKSGDIILYEGVTVEIGSAIISDASGSISTPSAPTNLVAVPSNGQASISFTPGSNGGISITNYKYSIDDGVTYTTFSPAVTSSPVVITGLTNGTTYSIKLRAVNNVGTGDASFSVSVTPGGAPMPPTELSAVTGNGDATVSFTPGSDSGSPITNYKYSIDGGSTYTEFSPAVTSSPVVITGLTNGTTYSIKLRAVNEVSDGGASASVSVTPDVLPSAPTSLSAVAGDGQAIVSFTPGVNNGSAITNYKYSVDGGVTFVAFSSAVTSSPVTITGLTNGTSYSIKLRAVNRAGDSEASASVSVTPAGLPFAPSGLSAVGGDTQAVITFTPGANNGSAITNYRYSIDGGSTYTTFSPAVTSSPATITGLTNGTTYSIKLRAITEIGVGGASASVSVTPDVLSSAPTSLSAVAGDGQAVISFTPGVNNGSAITNYKYSVDDGVTFVAFSPAVTSSPVTIGGLSNGTTYSIKLRAVNGAGDSDPSSTASVTPVGVPFAPSGLSAVGGDGEAVITFTPGANNGSAITNYRYSTDGGSTYTDFSPALPISPYYIISGLTNGTTYSIKFRAINSVGVGGASASVSVTPDVIASVPTSLSAVAGDGQAVISFTPGANNGSAITNYKYSVDDGITFVAFSPAVTSSPVTIGGLSNGTTYSIKLRAVNGAGDSDPSSTASVTPVGVPFAPSGLSAVGGDKQATISFTPGFNNGSAITNYKYSINGGATYTAFSPAVTSSPVTITGLDDSTSYLIKLRPVNSLGDGGASSSVSVTTFGIPSAPTSLTATPGDSQVSILFNPGAINGSAITNYKYSLDDGVTFTACSPAVTGSPILITGLTNNITYSIRIRAVNGIGDGIMSSTITVIPFGPPSPPTSLIATTGSIGSQATISFSAGSNGGSAITNYKYSINGGSSYTAFSPAVTSSPVTITALTNGITYSIKLRAVSALGDGLESSSVSVIPGIPTAPTNVTATSDDGQVTISFSASLNGGNSITNYKYSINDGSSYTAFSPAVTSSPAIITGLTNGTTYSIKLRAFNAIGDGLESVSVSVTPTAPIARGSVEWATTIIGTGNCIGYKLERDLLDNMYLCGTYISSSVVTINNADGSASNITIPSTNNFKAAFLVKYNSSGIAQWATCLNTTDHISGYSIVSDSENNVYISGEYKAASPVTLKNVSGNTQTNSSITLPITANIAIFLVKYNLSGIAQWATNIDGTSTDTGGSLARGNLSDIYVCGLYSTSSNIIIKNANGNTQSNSTITLPSNSSNSSAFLVKYNKFGFAQWAINLGDQNIYIPLNPSIATTSDSIYIMGGYNNSSSIKVRNVSGNTQIDSSIILPTNSAVSNNMFTYLVKYNVLGIAQWATYIASNNNSLNIIGRYITTDSENNVYITGTNCTLTAKIYNASGNTQVASSLLNISGSGTSTINNMFLIKYNSSGIAQWRTLLTNNSGGYALKSDSLNNIYVSGYSTASGTPTVFNVSGNGNGASSIRLPNASTGGAFLIKYNSSGIARWATGLDGTGSDITYNLEIGSDNKIYMTGSYTSTSPVTLKDASGNGQTDSSITLPSSTSGGVFLIKYT